MRFKHLAPRADRVVHAPIKFEGAALTASRPAAVAVAQRTTIQTYWAASKREKIVRNIHVVSILSDVEGNVLRTKVVTSS